MGVSMIKINQSQSKKINALIKKLCCNCYEGNCLLLDDGEPCKCVQLIKKTTICCNYFLDAVLPADKDLHTEILGNSDVKRCAICNKPISLRGNHQKYCSKCSKNQRLRKAADRQQKIRDKSNALGAK
ncbi:MAG: cysteine-rich VLP domain-containing protein [Acutalibacteraceae bacterium]